MHMSVCADVHHACFILQFELKIKIKGDVKEGNIKKRETQNKNKTLTPY